ncbi:glycosyltransferase [Achromobacter xylosoxidans]
MAFEHSSPAIHYGASRMRRLKYWLVSQTYRRHDAVVGVSEGVKEDLVSMFPPLRGKVHTIYNGVPLDDVREQSVSPPAPATAPPPGTNRTRSSRSAGWRRSRTTPP